MKLPEEQREITLKSKVQKGLLCLEVSNPVPGLSKKAKDFGSIPSTSKPDKANHGYGLRDIKEIVERYHGLLELCLTCFCIFR